MKKIKNAFQYLSYLQYPLMFFGLYYAYKPLIFGTETFWSDINNTLIFMGLGVSFSTLQDPKKMQNKFSQRIWENPKYANAFLIYLALFTLFMLIYGAYGYFFSTKENIQEVALGIMILGISLIGMLKLGIEMAENHSIKEEENSSTEK